MMKQAIESTSLISCLESRQSKILCVFILRNIKKMKNVWEEFWRRPRAMPTIKLIVTRMATEQSSFGALQKKNE